MTSSSHRRATIDRPLPPGEIVLERTSHRATGTRENHDTPLLAAEGRPADLFGFVAIQVVIVYGVAGYRAMGWSLSDAFFQVVILISGVGLGEVRPLIGPFARTHTIIVIALGISSVAFTLAVVRPVAHRERAPGYFGRQRKMRQIETLSGHTIVAGYGRVGALVCDELAAAGQPFVVVDLRTIGPRRSRPGASSA